MRRALLAAAAGMLAWVGFAQAGMLQVAPIPVEAAAPTATAIINLTNRADAPTALQLRIFRWTQDGGEDQLAPTSDVVLSPPIATVAPGATQIVRLVRVASTPVKAEESYRVQVDELPTSGTAGKAAGNNSVRIQMRYVLPVFFTPAKDDQKAADLKWSLNRSADGWALEARNDGGRRERISSLGLRVGNGAETLHPLGDKTLVGYVLGGNVHRWNITLPKDFQVGPGVVVELTYESDNGPVTRQLSVDAGH
jgi:fimbrial chaperone protein